MTIETVQTAMTDFLATQSQTLVDEIEGLLQKLDFDYYDKCDRDNIAAIIFEYEFSTFDIVAFAVDKSNKVVGDVKLLLTNKQYDYFFPDNIEEDFLEQFDEKERTKIEDDLSEYKYKAFENWFADCWDRAKGESRLKGFFSIHDTMWVTNLADRKQISDDRIPEFL
ncbi:MAG TPA: hypothetical protein VK772_16325 [Puia sp.]|nr:hypothetical protein [Puia sp.]